MEEETKEDKQSTKLSPYHAQNYFNSTMGGKDLRALFAMVVGCSSHEFPDHKDPLFLKSKAYHSEVKPDTATLKLEVKQHWKHTSVLPTNHTHPIGRLISATCTCLVIQSLCLRKQI